MIARPQSQHFSIAYREGETGAAEGSDEDGFAWKESESGVQQKEEEEKYNAECSLVNKFQGVVQTALHTRIIYPFYLCTSKVVSDLDLRRNRK